MLASLIETLWLSFTTFNSLVMFDIIELIMVLKHIHRNIKISYHIRVLRGGKDHRHPSPRTSIPRGL